ncbi:MAG: YhcH/YjgK/YiaL family protein [Lachnospiraceae bacterium]|nr:YhcH/YjgK/YiaL family protein [Lachnospiraceae bacterium]
MIIDYVEHYEKYTDIVSDFREGFQFALSLKDKASGRYELNEDVFALVQEGVTEELEDGEFESHKNYIDVQIIVEGEELMEWQELSLLTESIPYNETKDASFSKGNGSIIHVKENMFYLVFPHDAHKPCRHKEIPFIYKKIVLKLKIK